MVLRKFNVERVANDQATINELKAQGFVPVGEEKPELVEVVDYHAMSKSELVRIAVQSGIDGAKNLKKEELVEVLSGNAPTKEAEGDGTDNSADSDGEE